VSVIGVVGCVWLVFGLLGVGVGGVCDSVFLWFYASVVLWFCGSMVLWFLRFLCFLMF